jgi:hypothetical protein
MSESGLRPLESLTHWLTRYDEDDGEPYGQVCDCHIGKDHDGAGQLMFTDEEDE